jgi:hypothetical protein
VGLEETVEGPAAGSVVADCAGWCSGSGGAAVGSGVPNCAALERWPGDPAVEDPAGDRTMGEFLRARTRAPGAVGAERSRSEAGGDPKEDPLRKPSWKSVLPLFSPENSKESYEWLGAAFWLRFSPTATFWRPASCGT